MNEQIPEWLKQEAEMKYPMPVWDNDSAGNYMFYEKEEKAKELQEAYIAGALSRSGGVWVKVDYNNLPPEKFNPYFVKMCDNGIPGTLWPSDFKKWEVVYYLDETAADKGDAIEFAEWIDKNDYYKEEWGKWVVFGRESSGDYTTGQLYELFHQSK